MAAPQPDTFRGFIALPLPQQAHEQLVATQRRIERALRSLDLDLRMSRPEQLHVTLKFLGQVSREMIPPLSEAVIREAAAATPVTTTVGPIGVFGSPRRARVLVVHLADADGVLAALASRLEEVAESFGIAREARPFRPHVTLGRFRRPANAGPLLEKAELEAFPARLASLRLYESRLTPAGSQYTVLCEGALGVESG